MGTDRIVVLSPSLDQHLRLLQSVEDFHVQKFVSEFAIEALVVAVLPGTAGFDVERFHADPPEPGSDGNGCKLRTIVRSNVIRWAVLDEQLSQTVKNMIGLELALDNDRQTPSGELVDHRQHTELSSVMRSVLNEVVTPDMIGPTTGPEPDA